MASTCGGDIIAQEVFETLSADLNVTLPNVDFDSDYFKLPDHSGSLYDDISKITIEDLTTRTVDGTGSFDALMSSMDKHLEGQFKKNRITGKEYADVYVQLTTASLSAGVQFLLGKDQAYWAGVQAQLAARRSEIEAIIAAVQLENTKVQYAISVGQFAGIEASYALTKMQIATQDIQYCVAKSQRELIDTQVIQQTAETEVTRYTLSDMLPTQKLQVEAQTANTVFQTDNLMPVQKQILDEQYETARSQTTDMRSDGLPILGTVGAQVALYKQQKISYERDVDYKIAKMYMDQWVAQKSIDEGLTPPNQFVNAQIDTIFTTIRANANL